MKKIFIVLVLIFIGLTLKNYVFANRRVCFCHNLPHNPHTICTSNQGLINGHTAHVAIGFDSLGSCQNITPTNEPIVTPTENPNPTPTDEVTPTPTEKQGCREDCEITPTPEKKQEGLTANFSSNFSQGGIPICADISVNEVPEVWLENDPESNGILVARWGTNQYNKTDIRYSNDTDNMDRYSLLNTENDGREEIGQLDNNQHYFFQVRFRNGCSVGNWSLAVDPLP